jgi:hypothetical protein
MSYRPRISAIIHWSARGIFTTPGIRGPHESLPADLGVTGDGVYSASSLASTYCMHGQYREAKSTLVRSPGAAEDEDPRNEVS